MSDSTDMRSLEQSESQTESRRVVARAGGGGVRVLWGQGGDRVSAAEHGEVPEALAQQCGGARC